MSSRGHRDFKSAGSIFIQFDSDGVLSVLKPRDSSKEGVRGDKSLGTPVLGK